MSSKNAENPRPWSLALRLSVWYAASAFALVVLATGYLYLALARQLVEEDDEWLAGKASEVRQAAETRPDDVVGLRRLVEAGGGRAAERILIRVDDGRGPVPTSVETPGLSAAVPLTAFRNLISRGKRLPIDSRPSLSVADGTRSGRDCRSGGDGSN